MRRCRERRPTLGVAALLAPHRLAAESVQHGVETAPPTAANAFAAVPRGGVVSLVANRALKYDGVHAELNAKPSASQAVVAIAAAPPGPRVGAFFDLDGTLVAGFAAAAHIGDRICRRQAGVGEVLGVVEGMMRYRLGRMEFERLAMRWAGSLRGESLAELEHLGQRLFVDRIAARVFPDMQHIVEAHQERGHTVVLSSSALAIHAQPVARFLGITHVLCNHFELDERGQLTGDISRPVVWGPQKAASVERFCTDNGVELRNSYFYADGDEDLALMLLAGHPRPVNPRSRLAAAAAQRGWPVLQVAASGSVSR